MEWNSILAFELLPKAKRWVASLPWRGDHRVLSELKVPINSVTVEPRQIQLDPQALGPTTATAAIKAHLDLLLLGLESLSGESSEAVLAAAKALNLEEYIGDRVALWRLRNANPLRRTSGEPKKVEIAEARALARVIAYLAAQQQARIRSTLEQLEAALKQELSPFRQPLVGDYLGEFISHYRSRMVDGDVRDEDSLAELALRILIELLFYSSPRGAERLWKALLNRPEMDLPASSKVGSDALPSS